MKDQQGRGTKDDSGSEKQLALDALEHCEMKKER
jgi:hypothetical protein